MPPVGARWQVAGVTEAALVLAEAGVGSQSWVGRADSTQRRHLDQSCVHVPSARQPGQTLIVAV